MASVFCFSVPKNGNTQEEYEDSYSVYYPSNTDECQSDKNLLAAIADGASESSFSNKWADILVKSYTEGEYTTLKELERKMEVLSSEWFSSVSSLELPWYAEEKIKKGAYSTFLGLSIIFSETDSDKGKWTSFSVGDSCLFKIADGHLKVKYPLTKSDEFNNSPFLVSSNTKLNVTAWQKAARKRGTWKKGDMFVLATDGIASCLLQECEKNNDLFQKIIALTRIESSEKRQNEFESFISQVREDKLMKNDDVTCVVVQL
jgi:serine/threonine protein phosphatase PrpC